MYRTLSIIFNLIIAVVMTTALSSCQLLENRSVAVVSTSQPSNSAQNPPEIVSFTISPAELFVGQSAVLTWEVNGANEVDLSPNLGYVPATGTKMVTPEERTVYTLKATNNAGVKTRSVTISVNKNIKAVEFALTEDDVRAKGLKFDMNTEPQVEGCSSTYRIIFDSKPISVENSIFIYDSKAFMQKVFDTDKYNSRAFITNPLMLIGDEGYVLTNKSAESDIPDTYAIKFLKNNVYVKMIGNMQLAELESLARLVEKRIR